MKLKNVILFVAIIIVMAVVGIVIIKNGRSKKFTLETVTSVDYMLFSENNKYGVINKNGDVLVKSEYDEIDIPNPSKPVFICKYDFNADKDEYNIKVLNEKNEQILYQFYRVDSIKLDWDNSETPFEKSVLKFKQKGKYGLIDYEGNIILKAKYDEIQSLDFQEGLLLVKKKGKYGVVNIKGDYILKEKYDIIKANENFHAANQLEKMGFVVGNLTSNGYKYGYVNYKNQKILNIEYDQIELINNIQEDNTYFIAFKNGKAGFYNNRYNILKNVYDDISYNQYNNCLILEKDGKQGVFKVNGEMQLAIEYDKIFISGRYVNARKENSVEVYDYKDNMNKIAINNVIGLNETIDNDKYIIAISKDEKYKIKDVQKNEIKNDEYDYLEYIGNDEFIAYKNKNFGVVDVNSKTIVEFKYDDLQCIKDKQIIKGVIEQTGKITTEYIDYNGNIIEYSNNESQYPVRIGRFSKIDLGYGEPYYIEKK